MSPKVKKQGTAPRKNAQKINDSAFMEAGAQAHLAPSEGKAALETRHQALLSLKSKSSRFTGSADVDKAFAAAEPHSRRWDYAVGFQSRGQKEMAIWVEPHSGSSKSEVKILLGKLDWIEAKLKTPEFKALRILTEEAKSQKQRAFYWLSTGPVGLRPGSREAHMLAQRGLSLPASHLEL